MQKISQVLSSFANKILVILIVVLPIVSSVNGIGYEQTKVLIFLILVSTVAILSLFTRKKPRWNKIDLVGFVLIGIFFLTSITGINTLQSIIGATPYFQGWVVYAYLFLFYLQIKEYEINLTQLSWLLLGSSFYIAVLAIYQSIQLHIFDSSVLTYAGRVIANYGQPNFYSGYLLMVLPFGYLLFRRSQNLLLKLSLLGVLGILITAIIISESRTAILLTMVLVVVAVLGWERLKLNKFGFWWQRAPIKKRAICVLTLVIAGVLMAVFYINKVAPEIKNPFDTSAVNLTEVAAENRANIYPLSFSLISQRVITGYGLENLPEAFDRYFQENHHALFEANLHPAPVMLAMRDLTIDRSHNYAMDLVLFAGVPGLVGWILFVLLIVKRTKNKYLLIGLITYLVWIQLQNQSIVHLALFYLLAAVSQNESKKIIVSHNT